MTLGSRIQKYRNLHNISQKELGIKVGFSPATADVRIRQYESDKKCPKWEIRERIAEALDIDVSALYTETIQTKVDVVRKFFFMEEKLGFEIEKFDLSSIVFFNKNKVFLSKIEIQTLNSFMYIWQQQKKNLLSATAGNTEDSDKEYELWKSRFPRDIYKYWDNILDRINDHYTPLVNSLSETKPKTVYIYEFMKPIRKLIEAGLKFEISSETKNLYPGSAGCLVFEFKVSDLLSPKSDEIETLFTEFLNDLKTFKEYGMNIDTYVFTFSSGNTISYHLQLTPLTALRGCIEELIEFENKKDTMDDYSKELFETMYEHRFKSYFNLDIHEEIDVYCNHIHNH